MNSSNYQNQVNKLEKDISDLQKKIADEHKWTNQCKLTPLGRFKKTPLAG